MYHTKHDTNTMSGFKAKRIKREPAEALTIRTTLAVYGLLSALLTLAIVTL